MRCLHCGKHLPLFRKLTGGGEFCSDAHREKYHEEYNKLAVSRLLQAQSRPEDKKRSKEKEEPPPKPEIETSELEAPEVEAPVIETPELEAPEIEAPVIEAREIVPEVESHVPVEPKSTKPKSKKPDSTDAIDVPKTVGVPPETAPTPPPPANIRPAPPPEPEIQVVAQAKEFLHPDIGPVYSKPEWLPIDPDLIVPVHTPAPSSLLESANSIETPNLPADEAAFVIASPQTRRGDHTVIDTASPLSVEATHILPVRLDPESGKACLREAPAITRDALPTGYTRKFEPLAQNLQAIESPHPGIVFGASGVRLVTNDISRAGLLRLTLVCQTPDIGVFDAETETIATFRYLLDLQPAFDAELTLLDRGVEEIGEPTTIEMVKAPAAAVNGHAPENFEPVDVSPRRVLEVLSKLQEDAPPTESEPQPVAVVSPDAELPVRTALKTLTIATLAPGPAALSTGFPTIAMGTKPAALFYSPLPLRPKMALGNSQGPVTRRGTGNGAGRKGEMESPKNMPRSMLHLDQAPAEPDSEAEAPTLLGKIGGLFGRRHKNH